MRLRDLLAGACVALTMLAVIPAASAEGDAQEIGAIDTSAIPATKHGKMTAEQRSIFYGAKEDPPAKELLGVNEDYAGRSYLAGDEWNFHLTHEHIKDSGGIYVGVGADQGYLLASWAQAEYAYLIDYDARVVLTHKIYRSFFLRSKTPKEFVALWKKSSTDKALAIIRKDYADDKDLGELEKVYKEWRRRIYSRHNRINKKSKETGVKVYTNDQKLYDYVRGMVATDRIRPMSGNLLDDEGLIAIGEAARALKTPIRLLYVSNAQEYWKYPEQYRKNIAGLYFDEKSNVVHTLSTWSTNKDYRYVVQPGLNYQEWMTADWVLKVYYMIPRRKLEGAEDIDFIHFTRELKEVEERRAKRKKKKKK